MQDNNQNPEVNEDDNVDYIEAIKKLKETSVPREEFDKVKKQNRELLNAVINGQTVEQPKPVETVEQKQLKLKQLKKDLAVAQEKGMSNLEYVSKSLQYRDTALSLGLKDPFLPNGPTGYTELDEMTANKVAEKLQEAVDNSEGNPAVFRNLFEQLVRDDSPLLKKKKK